MSKLYQHLLLRRATEAEFYSANTLLKEGEPSFCTDTFTFKIGDGVTSWRNLPEYVHTNKIISKTVSVNIPSISPNSSASVSVEIDNLDTNNEYAVITCPSVDLPSYVVIKNSYVSDTNEVTIVFLNNIASTDGGVLGGNGGGQYSSTATNDVKLHILVYTVSVTTTTTTTTTTLPPSEYDIFSFGYNEFGQLGLNDEVDRSEPTYINDEQSWTTFGLGNYHSLGIDISGTLYSAGYNYYGQLGLGNNGSNTNKKQLTQVSGNYVGNTVFDSDPMWIKVAAGINHSLAIASGGLLFTCGDGSYGALGLGDTALRNKFTLVGQNYFFQDLSRLVNNPINNNSFDLDALSPVNMTKYIADSGTYVISGVLQANPLAIENLGKESLISYSGEFFGGSGNGYAHYYGYLTINVSGDYGSVNMRTKDNGYLTNGRNILYYTNPNMGWTDIAGGVHHSLGIKNGYLYTWGQNDFGQLGDGTHTHKLTPQKIGSKNDWVKVVAGNYHSVALDSVGDVYSFGYNKYGQLGHGNQTHAHEPTKIIYDYATFTDDNFIELTKGSDVAITETNGNVKYILQYESGKEYNPHEKFVLGSGLYVISGVPQSNAMAILNNGKEQCITYVGDIDKKYGTLELINTTADGQYDFYYGNIYITVNCDFDKVSIYSYTNGYAGGQNILFYKEPQYTVTDIDAGHNHTVMISNSNQVLTFGDNSQGQLGTGDTKNRLAPYRLANSNIEKISAGGKNTTLVDDEYYILSMGENIFGQLGLGDKTSRSLPSKIQSDIRWHNIFTGGAHSFATVSGVNII